MRSESPRQGVFVTGATGFVGAHFAVHFARDFSRISYLVRGAELGAATARLRRSFATAAAGYRDGRAEAPLVSSDQVVLGDLSMPGCGVDARAIAQVGREGVAHFWHFAASLSYEDEKRALLEATNVEGLHNAIELAYKLGAQRFIYVSTAYTCGELRQEIPESLHPLAGPFSNLYEQTKCQAEHDAVALCEELGLALTILRPSIVVGPFTTFRPAGSATGIYGVIREVMRLHRTLRATTQRVRIPGDGQAELNLIPVDAMMTDVGEIIRREFVVGPIVHLTAEGGPTVARAIGLLSAQVGITNLSVEQPGDASELSAVEHTLAQRTEFYASYMRGTKHFVRSLPSRWRVDDQAMTGLVVEGVREQQKRSVDHVFSRALVTSFDGEELITYQAGQQHEDTVILSPACGMPSELSTPVARRLSDSRRVLTWETRGVPSPVRPGSLARYDVDAQAGDLMHMVERSGAGSVDVVAWCSGVQAAVRAALLHPTRIRSLVLMNGSYTDIDAPATAFQTNMYEAMKEIAVSEERAQFFHRVLFRSRRALSSEDERSAGDRSTTILSSTDPELLHLTSLPFADPSSMYRYGKLITGVMDAPMSAWLPRVRQPILFITCGKDCTTHPEGTRRAALIAQRGELVELPDADHFALYKLPEVAVRVAAFLDSFPRPRESCATLLNAG